MTPTSKLFSLRKAIWMAFLSIIMLAVSVQPAYAADDDDDGLSVTPVRAVDTQLIVSAFNVEPDVELVGTITYELDKEGDGVFTETSVGFPAFEYSYDSPGDKHIVVKMTDEVGTVYTVSTTIEVLTADEIFTPGPTIESLKRVLVNSFISSPLKVVIDIL